jgi:pimeloyl-ACP methyl ester carboxylesterase
MPDTLRMQRAPVDGGHVEYVVHGTGDPMLFIHGAGIADAFLPLVNQPALAGIRQIHYRRRGYGQSTAVGGSPESPPAWRRGSHSSSRVIDLRSS